jgi:hypothetical protein
MRRTLAALAVLAAAGCAELNETLKQIPQPAGNTRQPIGELRIGAALKEALQVGTANAVKLTGRTDGYFRNEAIKILLPEQLRTLASGLRTIGLGPQVDQLVLGMNRAAERAAPQAKAIFWDAIGAMTIDDARSILNGGDTAATDYFRAKTSDPLTAAFRPIVEQAMGEVGVTRQYRELFARGQAIPFLKLEAYDLDRYVVGKALDGLFHVVADEERTIRTNPSARVTELLREVFGRRLPER